MKNEHLKRYYNALKSALIECEELSHPTKNILKAIIKLLEKELSKNEY